MSKSQYRIMAYFYVAMCAINSWLALYFSSKQGPFQLQIILATVFGVAAVYYALQSTEGK